MKAHLPENLTAKANANANIENILDNNKLMESIFENLGEGEDAGLTAVVSAFALPAREFAFVSEQILTAC